MKKQKATKDIGGLRICWDDQRGHSAVAYSPDLGNETTLRAGDHNALTNRASTKFCNTFRSLLRSFAQLFLRQFRTTFENIHA